MSKRQRIVSEQLKNTDGIAPHANNTIKKHQKMAESPFRFLRGSAPLFYRDISKKKLLPQALIRDIPLCMVQGDCHVSNFGFFTEEGSHGSNVIFGLNDFDDACVGHAAWDLLRYATSLYLTQLTLEAQATNKDEVILFNPLYVPDHKTTQKSVKSFLRSYVKTCSVSISPDTKRVQRYTQVAQNFPKDHVLRKPWQKATRRCAGGKQFLTKSALAKATQWDDHYIRFANNPDKFRDASKAERQDLIYHFEPFFDDTALDVVERLDAGTGSINMRRFYFLVGPQPARFPKDLSLCHIVEVKKQRPAAPINAFPALSPTNRLNAAHLTQVCQRRMQRSPDLILDETYWKGEHWLIRSRHHAKVGIDPVDLVTAPDKKGEAGIKQYAKLCGEVLALAHMRSDRRSSAFETAVVQHLPTYMDALDQAAQDYAVQTQADWNILRALLSKTQSQNNASTEAKAPSRDAVDK